MEYMQTNNFIEVLKLILLFWLTSGILIALGTFIIMWKREGFKFRRIYWWNIFDSAHMFLMVGILSFAWIALNIYWHYEHKIILRKIKEGKTGAKDLF